MAKTAGNAQAAPTVRVADQNPLEFTGGGLASDFDGTIIEARAVIWNYDNGKGPKRDEKTGNIVHAPFTRIRIHRGGEEEDIVSYYKAGEIGEVRTLDENDNLIDIDETTGLSVADGVKFALVGSREKMGKNTNHGFFLQQLVDAKFPLEKMKADIRFLEGAQGHWDRVAPPKRSGVARGVREEAAGAEPARQNDILVMSKYVGFAAVTPATTATGAGKATGTAASAAPKAVTAPSGAVADKLKALVVANLPDDGGLKKGSLAAKVMKDPGMTPQERSGAVKLISNDWFTAWANEDGTPIIFDPETGDIYKNAVE